MNSKSNFSSLTEKTFSHIRTSVFIGEALPHHENELAADIVSMISNGSDAQTIINQIANSYGAQLSNHQSRSDMIYFLKDLLSTLHNYITPLKNDSRLESDKNDSHILTGYFPHRYQKRYQAIAELAHAAANKYKIDEILLVALIYQESRFNPHAVSPKGAKGLGQLMPATAKELGVNNPYDPAQNLDGSARYLSQLLKRYDGKTDWALAAYNAGPSRVDRYQGVPPFRETKNYVRNITDMLKLIKAGRH